VYGAGGQTTNLHHRIELHDLRRKILLDFFPGKSPIACSPDGRRIATQGVEDGRVQVRLLGAPDGTASEQPTSVPAWIDQQADRPGKHRDVQALAFSPDGTILAASGFTDLAEGFLILLESSSGRLRATLRSPAPIQPPTFALAFTPTGTLLVTAGLGTKVQFWDVTNRRLADERVGHSAYIQNLAISSDGKTLATGSAKGTIKLWSLEQRVELLTLRAHERDVVSLRFSPDSQVLASSGGDGVVRLWRAPSEEELRSSNRKTGQDRERQP
jgi:WD40 repeat protein